MVKAVHFEPGTENLNEVDQVSEPSIRPRVGIDSGEDEAKTEKEN